MSVRPVLSGFCCGCFDSLDGRLHPGHVLLLQVAGNHCDVLTVAVNRDDYCRRKKGPNRPLLPLLDRMESVRRVAERLPCRVIVRVLMEDHPRGLLSRLKPDVMIVGSDYRNQPLPGVLHCQRVVFVPRIDGISTTALLTFRHLPSLPNQDVANGKEGHAKHSAKDAI